MSSMGSRSVSAPCSRLSAPFIARCNPRWSPWTPSCFRNQPRSHTDRQRALRRAATAAAGIHANDELATATAPPAAQVLATAEKSQLLQCQLGGGGGTLWLEVVKSRQGRVEARCCGELLQLSVDLAGQVTAIAAGFSPRLGDAWVKSTPGLADALKKVRQQQAEDGSLPSQLIAALGIAQITPLQTLAQFQAEVAAAPGPWCDGTAPGDAAPTEQDTALLTAGEMAAFLARMRGVCLVQLHKGWGDKSASLQAVLRPWVLALLQAAAEHKGVAMLRSAAPQELGASLVLCSRQQPFHAWGKHLASQGVQAAIVADSPFYKLLIGRILGYKEANIRHHIQSTGGTLSKEVAAAVQQELAALSSAPARLPWGPAGRRR